MGTLVGKHLETNIGNSGGSTNSVTSRMYPSNHHTITDRGIIILEGRKPVRILQLMRVKGSTFVTFWHQSQICEDTLSASRAKAMIRNCCHGTFSCVPSSY